MRLVLPIPPSVNHIWRRRGKATYLSENYQRWLRQAEAAAFEQRARCIDGQVAVSLTVIPGRGWRSNRDLDNLLKPTLDALCRFGLILDDNCSIVRQLACTIDRGDGLDARLIVEVAPYG